MKDRGKSSMEDSRELSQRREKFHKMCSKAAKLLGAMILLGMSRSKEEPEAIDQLVKAMEQVQNQNNDNNNNNNDHRNGSSSSPSGINSGNVVAADYDRLPEIGRNIDGLKLPRFPPQKILRGIVGECSEPFAKQLTATDVNRSHSRLSFGKEDVRRAIFPILNSSNENRELEAGIEVSVYDPRGKEYTMTFKTWAEHKIYVLSGKTWFQFANDNNLRAVRDWLNIWVFKNEINGRLCFAIDVESFDTYKLIKKKRATKKEEEEEE